MGAEPDDSGDAGASAHGTAAAASVTDASGLRRLTLGDRPLWSNQTAGISEVAGVVRRGRTAIISGQTAEHSNRLSVVDLETGDLRWTVDSGDPLVDGGGIRAGDIWGIGLDAYDSGRGFDTGPVVIDTGSGGWSVLVPYWQRVAVNEEQDRVDFGIAALSPAGTVRWTSPPLTVGHAEASDTVRYLPEGQLNLGVVGATDDVVVAGLWSAEGGVIGDARTVAVDADKGKPQWEKQDVLPQAIAGDTVLAARPEPGSSGDEPFEPVIAFDAADGGKRWDAGQFYSAVVRGVAGDTVAVTVTEGPDESRETVMLDLASGRQIGELDYPYCDFGSAGLVGCSTYDEPRLLTFRPDAKQLRPSAKPIVEEERDWDIQGIFGGYVVVEAELGEPHTGAEESVLFAVDSAGNRLSGALPGVVSAVGDEVVVFTTGGESSESGLLAYRLEDAAGEGK